MFFIPKKVSPVCQISSIKICRIIKKSNSGLSKIDKPLLQNSVLNIFFGIGFATDFALVHTAPINDCLHGCRFTNYSPSPAAPILQGLQCIITKPSSVAGVSRLITILFNLFVVQFGFLLITILTLLFWLL